MLGFQIDLAPSVSIRIRGMPKSERLADLSIDVPDLHKPMRKPDALWRPPRRKPSKKG